MGAQASETILQTLPQRKHLFRNYLFLAVGELAGKLVTFVAMAYLARLASPEGYGQIEFASSVLLCASLIVDQGFNLYGAREIARKHSSDGKSASGYARAECERSLGSSNLLASQIVFARFLLAVLAYLVVVAFAFSLGRTPLATRLILIYGLSLLGMPLLMQWVFQGYGRMGMVALVQLIRQVVFAGVVFLFIRTAGQIWISGLAETSGVVLAALFSVIAMRRLYGWRPAFKPFIWRLFADSLPIGLSQIFWTVRMFGATVILGVIAVPGDVGFFGGAMRILIALHAFVYLYFINLLPSFAQAWVRSSEAAKPPLAALVASSYRLVAWVGLLMGCIWVLVAPWVMVAVYGAKFASSGSVLQVLGGVFVIAALDGHYRFSLMAAGYQKLEMVASALGALATLIFIPLGYALLGVTGSAWGLLLAQVVVWLSTWLMAKRHLGFSGHLVILARPLVTLGVVAACLWLLPWSATIVRVLIASALFIILAFASDSQLRNQLWQWFRNARVGKSVHLQP